MRIITHHHQCYDMSTKPNDHASQQTAKKKGPKCNRARDLGRVGTRLSQYRCGASVMLSFAPRYVLASFLTGRTGTTGRDGGKVAKVYPSGRNRIGIAKKVVLCKTSVTQFGHQRGTVRGCRDMARSEACAGAQQTTSCRLVIC